MNRGRFDQGTAESLACTDDRFVRKTAASHCADARGPGNVE